MGRHQANAPTERLSDADAALARLLVQPRLTHDQALVGITAAFTGAQTPALLERLDEAARPLFETAGRELTEQAHALAQLMTNTLVLQVEVSDHRALLLDHAFAYRRAHPLLIATLGHELARRAGLSSHVVRCTGDYWTALVHNDSITLIGYGCLPKQLPSGQLFSYCPHEIAFATLRAIGASAPRAWADRATRLCAALPVEHQHSSGRSEHRDST